MTRRIALSLLAALFVVTVGTPLLAHEGHEHKILGTVTMAAPDHVMLKDKAGKDVTVHITADTKVLDGKKAMKVDDIKDGMRVVVTAVTIKEKNVEKMIAKSIQLGVVQAGS